MTATTTIHVNSELLALLSGSIIPLLVGLVSKLNASSALKAVLNALLTAIAGAVVTATQAGGAIVWQLYLINIGLAWLSSCATYFGLWKPTGVSAAIQRRTAHVGLGRDTAPGAAA